MITTWYLHSHLTWDKLCHSCMGSSFLPHGAFLEGGAYIIDGGMHAGSLEALRVARPEAVDLERIKGRVIAGFHRDRKSAVTAAIAQDGSGPVLIKKVVEREPVRQIGHVIL